MAWMSLKTKEAALGTCVLVVNTTLDNSFGVPTWCLRDDYHIARESDVTGCSTFQWDGRVLEVAEHVYHRGEVQVLHPALSTLCEHQA